MMGATIIPDEVTQIVLKDFIHNASIRTDLEIRTILCVCRQWHDVGTELIWQDISLSTSSRIAKLGQVPSSNDRLVRSITVSFSPLEPAKLPESTFATQLLAEDRDSVKNHGSRDTQALWSALEELASVLPCMTNLKCFSIYVRGQPYEHAPTGFWLRYEDILSLVRHLPPALISLELDTNCHEKRLASEDDLHVCTVLAHRFPQLKHLRLRLASVCEQLFESALPLNTATITTTTPSCNPRTTLCGKLPALRQHTTERIQHGREVRRVLVEAAQGCLARSTDLRRVSIIDTEKGDRTSASLGTLNVRDIKNDKTTSCPLFYVGLGMPHNAKVALRHTDKNDLDNDAVGNIADVEELVEEPMWHTTRTGCRFPEAYKDSLEGRKHEWVERRAYRSHEEYGSREDDEPISVWEDEVKSGRALFRSRVTEGLGDVEPIFVEPKDDSEGEDWTEDMSGDEFNEDEDGDEAEAEEVDGEED